MNKSLVSSKNLYEDISRELYYRDLRWLSGHDNDQEATQLAASIASQEVKENKRFSFFGLLKK